MKLVDDWKPLLKKAWSLRLIAISVVLMGVDTAMPFFAPEHPSRAFAYSAMVVSIFASIARLMPQKGLANGTDN